MLGWSPIDVLPEILMDVPDLVFAYTCDGRYLFVNTAAATFLGVKAMDVIGMHWRELGFPAEVMQPLVAHVASGREFRAAGLLPRVRICREGQQGVRHGPHTDVV